MNSISLLSGILLALSLTFLLVVGFRLKRSQRQRERVIYASLFCGGVLGFLLPLSVLLLSRFGKIDFPISWTIPLILFFPISLLIGLHLAKQHSIQSYEIQSEKRRSFGDFLTGLTHELKNPLTFIFCNIDPLKEGLQSLQEFLPKADPKSSQILQNLNRIAENMQEGAGRAQALLDAFQVFPSSQVRGPKEEVDLNSILDRTIEILSPKWKGRIRIERNLNKIPKIYGYPSELAQVFTNILANACDSIPGEGSIWVSTHDTMSGIKVVIRDTGVGVPKDQIGKVFDPFFTTKELGKGVGLGLSISLQIIKSHKGSVEVKSEEGKGTEFIIMLPYE